jgi:hypothetical protein
MATMSAAADFWRRVLIIISFLMAIKAALGAKASGFGAPVVS